MNTLHQDESRRGMIVAIHKPVGMTSHDVVDAVRRITGIRKIGHAGTLDPLASGVLVVAIGKTATKKLGEIVTHEKEYAVVVCLGADSTTDDAEGELTRVIDVVRPSKQTIALVLQRFVGTIEQIPPIYSAVKIRGTEAYKLARRGTIPLMQARVVEIRHIQLIEYSWPLVKLRVVTGPGVYIRALARDIGASLHTGGYLSSLVRTRVGTHRIREALTLKAMDEYWKKVNL